MGYPLSRVAVVVGPKTLASLYCRDGGEIGFDRPGSQYLEPSAKRRQVFGEIA